MASMRKTDGYFSALNNLPFETDNDSVQRRGPGKGFPHLHRLAEPISSVLAGEKGEYGKDMYRKTEETGQ